MEVRRSTERLPTHLRMEKRHGGFVCIIEGGLLGYRLRRLGEQLLEVRRLALELCGVEHKRFVRFAGEQGSGVLDVL